MPKVEVDLPELPHGYVYTGEYRQVHRGDEYICIPNPSKRATSDLHKQVTPVREWEFNSTSSWWYPIVKKLWQQPVGIFNPGWLAVDADGTVGWYAEQPTFWPDEDIWEVNSNAKNKSVSYFRLPTTAISTSLREDLLPPASLRGSKAIWQVG